MTLTFDDRIGEIGLFNAGQFLVGNVLVEIFANGWRVESGRGNGRFKRRRIGQVGRRDCI